LGKAAPLVIWALVLAIGAAAATEASHKEHAREVLRAAALGPVSPAKAFAAAKLVSAAAVSGESQRRLWLAAAMSVSWNSPRPELLPLLRAAVEPAAEAAAPQVIAAPEGAAKLLKAAMQRFTTSAPPRPPPQTALAALTDATVTGSIRVKDAPPSAYGYLEPDIFKFHRLTILQLGDSHTAADMFTGRVRERLQQVFGLGGEAYIVAGKPQAGVRSALFDSDASDGWNYEALQRSDARKRFYLSGFNAVAHHTGAELTLRSRGGRGYDRAEVAFLKVPGGGRAEVDVDGSPAGEINLDGAADERATIALTANEAGAPHGFRQISVKTVSDGPVTVTGVDVSRDGDGVSFISLGFPGATVELLQKLATENIADDFRHMEPDVVVLAFGTNEGFNDNLDPASYARDYEQIVRRLMNIRPGLRVVIVGPPDAARPTGACHAAGVGQDCGAQAVVSADPGGGQCRFPTPPKLALVREAQRKVAEKLGAYFWDWSSAMPGPCGAQVWAQANPPLMAHDFVHMTADGYKQSADRFADYLIPLIEGRQATAHVVSND
jgi:lysophospholipase L1-like esterase